MANFFERDSSKLTISEFYDNYKMGKYDFNVSYQRLSGVWSDDKKSFLIDSILKNYPMPSLFMRPIVDKNGKTTYHIIDGKQRLESIIAFIEEKIPLTPYFAEDDFIDDENRELASLISGCYFSYIKETEVFKAYIKQFWTYNLQVEYLYEDNLNLISSLFDRLNRNGEPLTFQELRNAKYSNNFIVKCIRDIAQNSMFKQKLERLKITRMEDEEFISELLFMIIDNRILDSNPEKLDKKYEQYKSNKKVLTEAKDKFHQIIVFMDDLEIDFNKYKRLYGATHLYTLFSVCWFCYCNNIKSNDIKKKINEFYNGYFSKNIKQNVCFVEYKEAASSRTRSELQRRKRMYTVLKFCGIDIESENFRM